MEVLSFWVKGLQYLLSLVFPCLLIKSIKTIIFSFCIKIYYLNSQHSQLKNIDEKSIINLIKMGMVCSCADSNQRKREKNINSSFTDITNSNKQRDSQQEKLQFSYDIGPTTRCEPVHFHYLTCEQILFGINKNYLGKLVESSGYYWRTRTGPLRTRHRPTVQYSVSNILRKNKFLLTKDVRAFQHLFTLGV